MNLGWTVGLLEGEGCFMIANGNCPVVTCEMTDLDILEKLQELHGGHIIIQKKRKEHYKQSWRWTIRWRAAADLMLKILPFMGERRQDKIQEVLVTYFEKSSRNVELKAQKEEAVKRYLSGESLRTVAKDYPFSYETIRIFAAKS